ncbi:MAG: arsenite S-adenosylmethyltransferase [Deltaproteobacteria bacterium HGW-Deltaproteobacteria-8]|jgi:SAM-dependent methyltransferase|nr:MAG: arsenite S-adenosylmethyltransferase [Deltaproteobacteria bacterium HGW-Deltaproteobacteria-8]
MHKKSDGEIRETVRRKYSETALSGVNCCGCGSGCCSPQSADTSAALAMSVGYSEEELQSVPDGANMGLGCGNPQAIAALRHGEVVVDLGSGGGFDCFLAARQVGETGRVIGVDMTPEMVEKARRNALAARCTNAAFRLGEIEYLPVANAEADVVLSNCVVNLSTDKAQVFREAFRVLKSGGRLAIADIVAVADMPEDIRANILLHASCVAGAARVEALEDMLGQAGFQQVSIRLNPESGRLMDQMFPGLGLGAVVASAVIEAIKP